MLENTQLTVWDKTMSNVLLFTSTLAYFVEDTDLCSITRIWVGRKVAQWVIVIDLCGDISRVSIDAHQAKAETGAPNLVLKLNTCANV